MLSESSFHIERATMYCTCNDVLISLLSSPSLSSPLMCCRALAGCSSLGRWRDSLEILGYLLSETDKPGPAVFELTLEALANAEEVCRSAPLPSPPLSPTICFLSSPLLSLFSLPLPFLLLFSPPFSSFSSHHRPPSIYRVCFCYARNVAGISIAILTRLSSPYPV